MKPVKYEECLYWYDKPCLFTFTDEGKTNIATITDDGKTEDGGWYVKYHSTEITQEELAALKDLTLSLRGAFEGKPWREVELSALTEGEFALTGVGGASFPEEWLPKSGCGIDLVSKDLPDTLSGAEPRL